MKDPKPSSAVEKEILRVALDKKATQAFAQMVGRMRTESPHVKAPPSAFVSFLVSDFYATYFDKDLGVLVAEFFDSQSYYEAQLQRGKSEGEFERVMAETLEAIRKVKAKRRRETGRIGKQKQSNTPPIENEEV